METISAFLQGHQLLAVLVTGLVGTLGAVLLYKLKFPAGCIVGSMLFTAVYCALTGLGVFPRLLRVIAQMTSGAVLGTTIDRSKLKGMKKLLLPSVLLLFGFFFINVVAANFLMATTDLPVYSCYFGTVPGGMTDMAIICEELSGDSTVAMLIQLFRLVGTLIVFPLIGPRFIRFVHKAEHNETVYESTAVESGEQDKSTRSILITLLVAAACGTLGYLSGVPAGAMIFSMAGVAIFKVVTNIGYVPLKFKRVAQTIAGTYIGVGVTMAAVLAAASMIVPLLLMLVIYFSLCMLLGWAMHRIFKLELPTTFFCCAPGGISDMALISADMGGTGPQVAVLQTVRLFGVILFFPQLIMLIVD